MTPAIALLLASLTMLIGAICATLHQALRDISQTRIDELVRQGIPPAKQASLDKILDDPVGHALAIAVPRVACNVAAAVLAAIAIAGLRPVTGDDEFLAMRATDLVIGGAGAVLVIWLVGLAIPLALAEHLGERLVLSATALLRTAHWLASPLRWMLGLFDEATRRLAGVQLRTDAEEIHEELLDVVSEGERGGQLDEAERDMIAAIVRFRQIDAERIMTPRTQVDAIEYSDDLDEIKTKMLEIGRSRIPVYRESLDNVVGIVYAKDLLHYLASATVESIKSFSLAALLREPTIVPEGKNVRDLLGELVAKGVHMAIVADEYGGTSGLVTMEDIVEEVFGEIRDEYEDAEEDEGPAVVVEESSANADARTAIHELNAALRPLSLSLPENEEYDTLGGFVVTELGRIPAEGETLRTEPGILLTVLEADAMRVIRVRIEPCSMDETGEPIEQAAADAARAPEESADRD